MKQELEKKGMTFRFVGQDMAALRMDRSNHSIVTDGRGKYRWKASYDKGDAVVRVKRVRCVEEEEVHQGTSDFVVDDSREEDEERGNDLYSLCKVALKMGRIAKE